MVKEKKVLQLLNITATGVDANTIVTFKNCAAFMKWITHINDEHVDRAENLDNTMSMYNLIQYSDNNSDTSGSLWQFKRDEKSINNGVPANVNTTNSTSFKYKLSLLGDPVADGNKEVFKNAKIAVPLKYLSNF